MTYVSRRARITVPRWPNDFDPEFLFRVGRRCDGRLKRHNSCLDLRAWINDNCIKNEYFLDLMSDGEVTLKPPLQLYGRFVPVPVLFKLLQNSRSENGAENTDWSKLAKLNEPASSDEEADNKDRVFGDSNEKKVRRPLTWGVSSEERESKPVTWGGTPYDATQIKEEKSKPSILKQNTRPREWNSTPEETHYGRVSEPGAGVEPTSGAEPRETVRRKWDPFEKMEYYTSGYAGRGSTLVEGYDLRSTPTQATLVLDDDSESKKSRSPSVKSGSEGNLARVLWEKNVTEKNLFKSTCLLSKAMGKLERIDNILHVGNEEEEKLRRGEIQEAFHKPLFNCIYIKDKNTCEKTAGSCVRYRVKSPGGLEKQDALRCSELLRQISGLREKLKKNQECQQKIKQEIKMSQRDAESGTYPQMTEQSSDGEANLRKLQKRLERLINYRGKLLSDMCQALTLLNHLKRSRNSKEDLRQRSKSTENRKLNYKLEMCSCSCRNCRSSESEKAHCSESASSTDTQSRRTGDRNYYEYSSADNPDSGQQNFNDESYTKNTDARDNKYAPKGEFYKDSRQEKDRKKSVLRFQCPHPPCKEDFDDDLSASKKYHGPLSKDPHYRPSTSPTTKQEKSDALEERQVFLCVSRSHVAPERRVKSETTMKEIEKTLRNYEQRLNDMDGLEYMVEEWKKKLLDACRWKKRTSKMEAQMNREQEDERNKATTQINGLFMQNYELKKQVRQLIDKSKEQAKKIQTMKSSVLKARELETEAEELKKELAEYRNSYEHQRKCISKWESVVALQRKEIENLMNHIRKLTTEKKEHVTVYCQDRKYVQRTRSCSPGTLMECQTHCRPETYNLRSDEENGSCCCQDFRQPDSRRNQTRCIDKNYYSSVTEKEDWCD